MIQFAGLTFELPPGWFDITDNLASGSPATLAREAGVGAIQFSVARYKRGAAPNVDRAALEEMFRGFCEQKAIAASPAHLASARCLVVGGISRSEDAIVGVWYLSDRKNVAMVSYYADSSHAQEAGGELADAEAIVRTTLFPDLSETSD